MKAFFVGIKGVGMTSLACAMQDAGWSIEGSDTHEEFITDEVLSSRRVIVHQDVAHPIPSDCDLVICSAAFTAPETHVRTVSLAEALAQFVKDRKVLAIAGVGGKTTTSAMCAALFHSAGRDVGYYVGTSTIAGLEAPGHNGTDPYFIVEADEYAVSKSDRRPKFSLLQPEIVITTNIIHDHPDIYPNEQATTQVFADLIRSIKPNGTWIYNPEDKLTMELRHQVIRTDITMIPYKIDRDLDLSVFGDQNNLDAVAAVRAATAAGVPAATAREHIKAYKGAGRRQEFHGLVSGRYLFDDYGHHPAEIEITVRSFKEKYTKSRILLVFESHTYSRTEALLNDFARAIATADLPFIMPIFESAREKGKKHSITPESFTAEVAKYNSQAISVDWDNAAEEVAAASSPGDVILTMGAGFVYKLHKELKKLIK